MPIAHSTRAEMKENKVSFALKQSAANIKTRFKIVFYKHFKLIIYEKRLQTTH